MEKKENLTWGSLIEKCEEKYGVPVYPDTHELDINATCDEHIEDCMELFIESIEQLSELYPDYNIKIEIIRVGDTNPGVSILHRYFDVLDIGSSSFKMSMLYHENSFDALELMFKRRIEFLQNVIDFIGKLKEESIINFLYVYGNRNLAHIKLDHVRGFSSIEVRERIVDFMMDYEPNNQDTCKFRYMFPISHYINGKKTLREILSPKDMFSCLKHPS